MPAVFSVDPEYLTLQCRSEVSSEKKKEIQERSVHNGDGRYFMIYETRALQSAILKQFIFTIYIM